MYLTILGKRITICWTQSCRTPFGKDSNTSYRSSLQDPPRPWYPLPPQPAHSPRRQVKPVPGRRTVSLDSSADKRQPGTTTSLCPESFCGRFSHPQSPEPAETPALTAAFPGGGRFRADGSGSKSGKSRPVGVAGGPAPAPAAALVRALAPASLAPGGRVLSARARVLLAVLWQSRSCQCPAGPWAPSVGGVCGQRLPR